MGHIDDNLEAEEHRSDTEAFRAALQKITAAVIIVATSHEGRDFGQTVTATAVASASVDPPMLLVSFNAAAPMAEKIRQAGFLSVNYVAEDQHELARELLDANLSSTHSFETRDVWRRRITGAPVLADAVASMDCNVREIKSQGANVVFTSEVRSIASTEKGGLLYRDGLLRRLDATS